MIRKSLTRKCALWALAAGTLLCAGNILPTLADTAAATTITSSSDTADMATVLAQVAALTRALAASDAAALSSLWSATGQYVNKGGEKYAGRDMLEKRFATLFGTDTHRPVSWHFDSNGSYGFGTMFETNLNEIAKKNNKIEVKFGADSTRQMALIRLPPPKPGQAKGQAEESTQPASGS